MQLFSELNILANSCWRWWLWL